MRFHHILYKNTVVYHVHKSLILNTPYNCIYFYRVDSFIPAFGGFVGSCRATASIASISSAFRIKYYPLIFRFFAISFNSLVVN